jgi:hypothetical protein
MNARVQAAATERLIPAIEVLEIRAQTRAFLWWQYQMEMDEAVDELQAYAERSGLVIEIGQDAVQAIIAAPFARLRAMAADDAIDPQCPCEHCEYVLREHSVPECLCPTGTESDYAAQIVRQWELDDPRDRWRHTGEPPPEIVRNSDVSGKPVNTRRPYSTPDSVVDAFFFVARQCDRRRLARWIADHPPADKAELFKLWKAKRC